MSPLSSNPPLSSSLRFPRTRNEPTYSSLSLSNRTSSSLDRCLSLPLDVSMNRVIRHHISSTRHLGISRDSNESHALLPSFPFFLFLSPPSSTRSSRKNALRSVAFSMYNYFRHVVFYPIFYPFLFPTFEDKASLKRCSFSTRPLNETFRTGYLLSAQNRSS